MSYTPEEKRERLKKYDEEVKNNIPVKDRCMTAQTAYKHRRFLKKYDENKNPEEKKEEKNLMEEIEEDLKEFYSWEDVINIPQEKPTGSDTYRGILIGIFGIAGSGKTHIMKEILYNYRSIVYDITGQFKSNEKYQVVHPKKRRYPENQEEFNKFGEFILKNDRPLLVGIDEVDLLIPKAGNGIWNDIINTYRHSFLNFVYTSRRPQKVNTDLVENSHYLICFRQNGENAIKKLNNVKKGLGTMCSELEDFEYLIYSSRDKKNPIIKIGD